MAQAAAWFDRFSLTAVTLMMAALPMAAIGFVARSL